MMQFDPIQLACVPYMYHSAITGEYITERKCYGLRMDTNYYFSIDDFIRSIDKIAEFILNKRKELNV